MTNTLPAAPCHSQSPNLLQTTDLLLEAVAQRSGFSNAQYMSLVFQKQLGSTPGAMRTKTNRARQRAEESQREVKERD